MPATPAWRPARSRRSRAAAIGAVLVLASAVALCPIGCSAAMAHGRPARCHGHTADSTSALACCRQPLAVETAAPAAPSAPAVVATVLGPAAVLARHSVAPPPAPVGRVGPPRLYLRTHALLI